jgi:hypothetical protein
VWGLGAGGRACAALVAAIAIVLSSTPFASASLPSVGSGPRPGPDILYAPPTNAPQLQNTGVWKAPPILISAASAYRDGEFLYQDLLYDDHGARGARDPGDPRLKVSEEASAPFGSYTYPTDPVYAGNAADLVELRVKPLPDATAFRLTLNTMKGADRTAFTIAIGGTPGASRELPHGANAKAPADLFLTVHGEYADLLDATTGQTAGSPTAKVDLVRRQVDVRVPHTDWDPGASTLRLAAGVGLWDAATGSYLLPGASATATTPGGAGGLARPTAIFNAAFRASEPFQGPDFSVLTGATYWRDRAQGFALRQGDLGPFSVQVDFAKLAAGADDDMPGQPGGVPQSGPMDRILASSFETGQGLDYSTTCAPGTLPVSCKGELRGRLQPYAIYVPSKPQPAAGYGLTLLLHSYGGNYNQYASSRNQSQLGDRGAGSLVVTPEARGPDGWYFDHAGADVFEVWADVARHYPLDPDWTALSGYSMGGYGTFKLASQYPDLFGRAQTTVGPSGFTVASASTREQVDSLRNIPILMWAGGSDQSVPPADTQAQADRFDALGYRYEFDLFTSAIHILLAFNDQYQPAADFLGSARVDRNPAHVTYVYNPAMDFPDAGTAAGHAYWVSRVLLRDAAANGGRGRVDVRSEGFGLGDPVPSDTAHGSGTLAGGALATLQYASQSRSWGSAPPAPLANRLVVDATNVSTLTIDPRRARVGCDATIALTSDGPTKVRLAGCEPHCRKTVPAHGRNGRPPGLCKPKPGRPK